MRALPARRIALFVLRFSLAWGALFLAWPVLRPVYRPFYCALGNLLFQGEGSVRFQALDTGSDFDIELVMRKRAAPGVIGRATNNSHAVGYLPTVSLIAFVLATPITWRRRWRALLWGFLLVNLFVALRIAIPVVRDFSKPDALQIYELGSVSRWLLGIAERSLLGAPASTFVVPVFIWILVAFRRQDWELLEEPEGGPRG